MAGLKEIKNKIKGIEKTHKVTKAMEAVSAVKMRKSQERAMKGRPYATAAISILRRVGGSFDALKHPLVVSRDVRNVCLTVITSDKGLAGSLNGAVLKAANDEIRRRGLTTETCSFICIGRKGYEHFAKRGFKVLHYAENISDDVRHDELLEVSRLLSRGYEKGTFDLALLIYTNFVSTFEQRAAVRTALPLNPTDLARMVHDITPARGRYAKEEENGSNGSLLYTVEPDPASVLHELLPFLLRISVYHALLEGKASEHSARMVAMKNASDKARDLSKDLTREFNKARQSLITREVSEIVGGIEAMK